MRPYEKPSAYRRLWACLTLGIFILLVSIGISRIIPDRAWDQFRSSLIIITGLGVWRYSWLMTNTLRCYTYLLIVYPRLARKRDRLPDAVKYPRRVYLLVPSYKESPYNTQNAFTSFLEAAENTPCEFVFLASVASQEEANLIQEIVDESPVQNKPTLLFTLQKNGKRLAMGHGLRVLQNFSNQNIHYDYGNDIVVLVDGDSCLEPDVFQKCLPYFKMNPKLGALTTDERAKVLTGSHFTTRWYELKFFKRHLNMSSHALSKRVLTLTGRGSMFRASLALNREFIELVESDHIYHWLFGDIRFLMGDDKSTLYCTLKNEWEMLYVPDAMVWAMEDRDTPFFLLAIGLMRRWYGNMLRNNGRCIKMGPSKMPFFIWLAFVDQRLSMWTTLVGPVSVLLLAIVHTPYNILFYIMWVLIVRGIQLMLLVPLGLLVRIEDLFFQLIDQWLGSIVKVHSLFHLHLQTWSKKGAKNITNTHRTFLQTLYPKLALSVTGFVYILFVIFLSRALRLPTF